MMDTTSPDGVAVCSDYFISLLQQTYLALDGTSKSTLFNPLMHKSWIASNGSKQQMANGD